MSIMRSGVCGQAGLCDTPKAADRASGRRHVAGSPAGAGPLDGLGFVPAVSAICYPFLLDAFHLLIAVGRPGSRLSALMVIPAILVLAAALTVPAIGLAFAARARVQATARRLAYATVLAPTLYVFLGVVQSMARSPVPDEIVWCFLWAGAVLWACVASSSVVDAAPVVGVARWRVVHGVVGAIVLFYVLFHLANHLLGLIGPEAHAAMMDLGRRVYRAPVVEPVLVALLLFQIATGLRLAWRWSAAPADFHRTFQVASGVYLSVFVLGHMNSVFLYARAYLGIPTDWAFATGAPAGLIHDAWNIRLLPHYALGVFFVLAHLSSALRAVLIAHGTDNRTAGRIWTGCASVSAVIAAAIIAGMVGVRIALP
jgi:hypothetical protein